MRGKALVELAVGASGNPFILAEAFRGLLDEEAIAVADGRASLTSAQVSGRIQILAADRLKGLSAPTRQFTENSVPPGEILPDRGRRGDTEPVAWRLAGRAR